MIRTPSSGSASGASGEKTSGKVFGGRTLGAARRALLAATVVAAIGAVQTIPALAAGEPQLVSTSPANGATVSPSVAATVRATYDRALKSPDSHLVLRDQTGTQVAGAVTLSGDGRSVVFAPTEPLPGAGSPYQATATAVPAAAGGSTISTFAFSIDGTVPDAPVIDSPADGDLVTGTVHVTGDAEPGSTVRVYEEGEDTPLASGIATGGAFDIPLPYGEENDVEHTIVATATDGVGNTSEDSASVSFRHDNVAPGTPAITDPADGTTSATSSVALSGTAADGDTVDVVVYDAGTEAGTAIPAGGDWTVTIDGLGDGTHPFTARARDAAGNLSTASGVVRVTVDAALPSVLAVDPSDGASRESVAMVSATYSEPLAGGTLRIRNKSNTLVSGTTVIDGGTITFTPTGGKLLGSASPFTATTTGIDTAGNAFPPSGDPSYTWTFAVTDTVAPRTPVIESPAQGAKINTCSVTVSGFADAGSSVMVREGGTGIGTALAAANGRWSLAHCFTPDGPHTIKAKAEDGAGNQSGDSAARTFTIDTAPPAAPVIDSPAADAVLSNPLVTVGGTAESGTVVTVRDAGGNTIGVAPADGPGGAWSVEHEFGEGPHTIHVKAKDGAGNESPAATRTFTVDTQAPAAPSITTPAQDQTTAATSVTLGGAVGSPDTMEVLVYDGETQVATTTPSGGSWSATISDLSEGAHPFTAKGRDKAGHVSDPSGVRTITVDLLDAPVIATPAEDKAIPTTEVTIGGTASQGTTVLVYDGDGPVATAPLTNGAWSATISSLSEGLHSFKARATDGAGNLSAVSNVRKITVDTQTPEPPSIDPLEDALYGPSVTISGTAEAGVVVEVLTVVEGAGGAGDTYESKGTATAGEDGEWSLTATFATGSHTIVAAATDAAGNESDLSEEESFAVDADDPGVAIATEDNTLFGPTETVTITGTASDNDTVRSVVVTFTPAAGNAVTVAAAYTPGTGTEPGTWTAAAPGLFPGPYTVTATATDGVGNTKTSSPITIVAIGLPSGLPL